MNTQPEKPNHAWLRWFLIFGLLALSYPLSMGPALRLSGAKPGQGWHGVPEPVRSIYLPLASLPMPDFAARMLDQYLLLWMTE